MWKERERLRIKTIRRNKGRATNEPQKKEI